MTYRETITAATGVTDPKVLEKIEDTMRQDVFHSTLDSQSKAQLRKGAREAYGLIRIMQRPAVAIALPEDPEIAGLLGVTPDDVMQLRRELP